MTIRSSPNRYFVLVLTAFLTGGLGPPAKAYSVLTHEAIIDSLWIDAIRPALLQRFPDSSEQQLNEAHAYVYGGSIIQDLGYYPFGSHFFSDLVHYVRTGDFLQALLDESNDLNEYAFAIGAVAHYGADVEGHSIAVNRAVPILFPKLRGRYGDDVSYADNPSAHLKTEFGFDVLQTARGNYASQAYHDFIGFQVSKELLDRAFQKTYGLKLKDLFHTLDLSLGTYRYSVSRLIPTVTRAAWAMKGGEIAQARPTVSRKQFIYNIKRADFTTEWGPMYERPGFGVRLLTFLFRLVPRFGPFKGFGFKVPTPEVERMFEDSFDASIQRNRRSLANADTGRLRLTNRDLDTGKPVSPGEYVLTDRTYDTVLKKLAEKKFESVTPELRKNILDFYASMKVPDPHGIDTQLAALKALTL